MRDSQPHTQLIADLLARGYLRLLERQMQDAPNPASCPKVTADCSRSICLEIVAQQSDELGAQHGIRRRQCNPT
jgi:hypothetical protein